MTQNVPYLNHFQCHFDLAVVVHLDGKRTPVPPMLRLRHAGSFFSFYDILPDRSCRDEARRSPSVMAALAVLLLAVLPLAVRNLLAIPVLAPLDPNEGWNAAHTLALMAGHALYPPPQSLMVNNYPPLSFYLVAALTRHGHDDAVIAGRMLSLLAFLATGAGIALVLRQMGCHWTRGRLRRVCSSPPCC